MSTKTMTTHYCDVCKREIRGYSEKCHRFTLPVRFLTEQNEGYPTSPYYSHNERLDLCSKCAARAIVIDAEGAMGYNRYWFREVCDDS